MRPLPRCGWAPSSRGVRCQLAGTGPATRVVRAQRLRYTLDLNLSSETERLGSGVRGPHHWLEREPDAEARLDLTLEPARKCQHVPGPGAVVGDDGQRVTGGEPHRALALASSKAGSLDQPGRRKLHAP